MSSATGPDYVVVRRAPGMPVDEMPPDLEGKWFDRARIPIRLPSEEEPTSVTVGEATATPAGRFEVREDGVVAEVWEVRW